YLPHSWTDDPARRKEARIPDDLEFKTRTRSRSRCSSARSPTGCRSASCSPTRRTKVTSRAAISYGYRGPEASLSVGKRRAALRVRGADGKARQSGAVVVVQRTSSDLELYEESRCTVRGGGLMLPGVPRIALRVLSDSPTLWLADARCQDLPAAPEVCADPGNHLVLTRRGMFVQHVGGSARRQVVVDPGTALFLNGGDVYRTTHPRGGTHDCTLLRIAPSPAAAAVAALQPAALHP